MLVVGGAGSIGSSYIKEILPFKPKTLVVVDINENGLAELTRDIRSTKGLFVPKDLMLLLTFLHINMLEAKKIYIL